MIQLQEMKMAAWLGIKNGLILNSILMCAFLVLLFYPSFGMCIDGLIQFTNFDYCHWPFVIIFIVLLSILFIMGYVIFYKLYKITRLNIILLIIVSAIVVSLFFIENLPELKKYGSMLPVFTTLLGFMVSGKVFSKTSWNPRMQFLTLLLIMVFSILIYTLDIAESGPPHIRFILRLIGEISILVGLAMFGEEAKKWFRLYCRLD